jgi:hypothetical protein
VGCLIYSDPRDDGYGAGDTYPKGGYRPRAVAIQHVAHYDAAAHGSPSAELELGALGSGSDFTPFLQHLGVNSLDVGFEGETDYGVYHSKSAAGMKRIGI